MLIARDKNMEQDDPFDLIHRGNAFTSSSSHWSAADAYSRASLALRRRADALSHSCTQVTRSTKKREEDQKIMGLYITQAAEYFYKARHSLLRAMMFENEQDRVNAAGHGTMMCSLIGDEEEERRRHIFDRLFVSQATDTCKSKSVGDCKAATVESEECMGINIPAAPCASLPSINASLHDQSLQNADQDNDSELRLDEIRTGLKRLGVSLPDQDSKHKDIRKELLSSDDQVKLIVQQATDEVLLEKSSTVDENCNSSEVGENDSMFESYDPLDCSDVCDLDTLLIQVEKVVAAAAAREETVVAEPKRNDDGRTDASLDRHLQVIRDAQALLLEARLCLELEREEDANAKEECNRQEMVSQRRHRAMVRIHSAIRCLRDGFEHGT